MVINSTDDLFWYPPVLTHSNAKNSKQGHIPRPFETNRLYHYMRATPHALTTVQSLLNILTPNLQRLVLEATRPTRLDDQRGQGFPLDATRV